MEHEDLHDQFAYLDDLRESGRTNMWGATEYLVMFMGMERKEARRVHRLWMDTFDGKTSLEDRVARAAEQEA